MIWSRSTLNLLFSLVLLLAACVAAPAPTPTPTDMPTATIEPTLAPAPSPTPTIGAVPQQIVSEPETTARVRIIQAASEVGAIDVYLEQALVGARLSLGAYTNPVQVAPGRYYLRVVAAGTPLESDALADTLVTLEPEQSYLLLVAGTAGVLNVAVYQEDLSHIPADQARLSFLNGVPRGRPANLQIDSAAVPDGLDFGQISPAYTIEAGSHTLAFSAGIDTLAEIDSLLAPQQVYTAVLFGYAGGGGERILLLSTQLETAGHLRFINAHPDSGPITVLLDDTSIAQSVGYRQATEWLDQMPQTYLLRLENAAQETVAEARIRIDDSQAIELVLLADQGRPSLRVYTHTLSPTPPGIARLVVVNTAPEAPLVYAQAGRARMDEIPGIPAASNSPVIDLPATQFELRWMTGQNTESRVAEWAGEITLRDGHAYTYIVTGANRQPFLLETETGIHNR